MCYTHNTLLSLRKDRSMSIVISYSHEDSDFVSELGANLFKNRVPVWIDRWELTVGDSLIRRIEEAITKADALIVVLSKTSVESEWCKKELTSGLVIELEAKSVFVLPVVIDDCEIPLFLKEKLYADFRKDKDKALQLLLEATARFTTDTLHRESTPSRITDYGLYWGVAPDRLDINLTLLDMPTDQPYSVITEIYINCNETVAKRYEEFTKYGFDWFERSVILSMVSAAVEKNKSGILVLEDSFPKEFTMTVTDSKRNVRLHLLVKSRRLGQDTGKDIAVDWGLSFKEHVERLLTEREKLPKDAKEKLLKLIKEIDF